MYEQSVLPGTGTVIFSIQRQFLPLPLQTDPAPIFRDFTSQFRVLLRLAAEIFYLGGQGLASMFFG